MSDFLNTSICREWGVQAVLRHSSGIFGQIKFGVIWSDARDEEGNLLVSVDPIALVVEYNREPPVVLRGHDPGKPLGQLLECELLQSEDGRSFVVAAFGLYAGGNVLQFDTLGIDALPSVSSPRCLPDLPNDVWIDLACDPREVAAEWLEAVASDAPLQVQCIALSHNAADSTQELIRVGLPYLVLVWNPFVTSIASEAGKAVYAGIHGWLRRLIGLLANCREPILDIQAHQDGCQVSFHFRGKDPATNYAAHGALSNAAAGAAQLITNLKARGMPVRQLIYEFDGEKQLWYPSYAILNDNRIVASSPELIAIENLPAGLSLGIAGDELIPPLAELMGKDKEE